MPRILLLATCTGIAAAALRVNALGAENRDVGADQINRDGEVINRPLDTGDIGKLIGPSGMGSGASGPTTAKPN